MQAKGVDPLRLASERASEEAATDAGPGEGEPAAPAKPAESSNVRDPRGRPLRGVINWRVRILVASAVFGIVVGP